MSSVVNTKQIESVFGVKKLLEVNDFMSVNTFDEKNGGQVKSTVHSRFSKIQFVSVDWSKGSKDKASVCKVNLDIDSAKFLFNKLLDGDTAYFTATDSKTKMMGFFEEKIGYEKFDDGKFGVTKINVSFQQAMSASPWKVTIENGKASKNVGEGGKTTIAAGTYEKISVNNVFMNNVTKDKLAITVLDYIRSWETAHVKEMEAARTEFEKKLKEQRSA